MQEWAQKIQEMSAQTEEALNKLEEQQRIKKIAKELSDLIYYCVSLPYNEESKFKEIYLWHL